jgi:UDP-3-O-[3-hydroxymyristoyl] glucosamine N-acyltransferase
VNIGHQCMLGAKAGVMSDIPDQGVYAGIPATPIRKQIGMIAALIRLPEMRKALKRLEKAVALMKSQEPTAPRQDAA